MRLLCNRVKDGLAGLGLSGIACNEDRAVTPLYHRARPAHGRVEKAKAPGRRGLSETARKIRRDRAHLNERGATRRSLDQPVPAKDRRLDTLERRQDREDRISLCRGLSNALSRF